MRIAVFNHDLPVRGEKRGGVPRVAHALADGLALRGHEVVVWTHDPKPEGAAYEVRPLPARRLLTTWLGRRMNMGMLGNFLALAPAYQEFDAIIAHGDSLLLPLARKPLIRVMHGSALAEALSTWVPWRFLMQLGIYVQELLTGLTQGGCVAVSSNTCRYNPFIRRVIPNGIDLATFYPDPAAKTPEPSVLFVGTLGGRKRGRLLIDHFVRHVAPRFPTAALMMVTTPGPAVPGVTYYTAVSDADLAALYRRAWVYASPSRYEGFGLPYLEAMASGTPVLATANPGSRELLDNGRCGRVVPEVSFGAALTELLADAEARQHFSLVGLERASEYSLPAMVERYEKLLFDMVGKSHLAETIS
jgi:phosphatidylinositol alpha-mannosyltransferase